MRPSSYFPVEKFISCASVIDGLIALWKIWHLVTTRHNTYCGVSASACHACFSVVWELLNPKLWGTFKEGPTLLAEAAASTAMQLFERKMNFSNSRCSPASSKTDVKVRHKSELAPSIGHKIVHTTVCI